MREDIVIYLQIELAKDALTGQALTCNRQASIVTDSLNMLEKQVLSLRRTNQRGSKAELRKSAHK